MYSLYTGYYVKIRNPTVGLISRLPDSNKNSAREFQKVSGKWLVGELTCPMSAWEIGRYSYLPSTPNVGLIAFVLPFPYSLLVCISYFIYKYIYIHFSSVVPVI